MRVGSNSAWAKLGEYPGYVLMRAAARFSSVRNACVAVRGRLRPSLAEYQRGIETRGYLFVGKEAREVLQIQYAINDWGVQHDERDETDLVMM